MDPSYAKGASKMLKDRKRQREEKQYNRQLRALSNLLPGSKAELDEVLVVENATKYIKHLEERVDSLERRLDSTIGEEDEQSSVVLSEDTKSDSDSDSSLPQILVYISLRDVIISIQCKNHKNIIWETISEVEKQQLSVISFNTMSFGRAELVINILAKIKEGALINANDLRNDMRLVILKQMED
ncbi:uncharacterized protein LOC113781637 [Coffea eugenioides]|uniref:Uncharacterized protein LOC113705044 isoform X1 n=1 Tax=Coffea arabica TaxID=13443 RepID=A0A6P6TWI5_COFAR|nr:uncharacterized protein LOC113705044 isoform X1 [Coffea arabica]XP_027082709.1 uncharacterized protein LOC113705044 isoform X1 [Coffea arabica]XP_027082710.1 uncharacterized protein LOC113705044 isoform X1 [Coffea arabica]XP_027082711.1 uncharacterized protein LOC113705044 isoform X1 [Coffea arabica]XP_027183397.1 uncharacterized protein LOC113781637 [Coffea eugenioides]